MKKMIRIRGAVKGVLSKARHCREAHQRPPVILKNRSVKQGCVESRHRTSLSVVYFCQVIEE